jgi:hypothetical protein
MWKKIPATEVFSAGLAVHPAQRRHVHKVVPLMPVLFRALTERLFFKTKGDKTMNIDILKSKIQDAGLTMGERYYWRQHHYVL